MDRKESVVLKWVSTVDTAQQAARDQRQPAEGGRVTSTAGTRCRPSTVRAHYPQSTGTFFFFFFFFYQCTSTTVYSHCRYPVPVVYQPQSAATAGTRCTSAAVTAGTRCTPAAVIAGTRYTSASHCRYPVYVNHSERKEDVSLWKLLI